MTLCAWKPASILLASYSNLISVLLNSLDALCPLYLASILLSSYSNLTSVLLLVTTCTLKLDPVLPASYSNIISVNLTFVLFAPYLCLTLNQGIENKRVEKCPPLRAGPRFQKSATATAAGKCSQYRE